MSFIQTFLPYPSFAKSARCLDDKRLGKQRVEAYTILRVLRYNMKGWRHHPAVLMWEGYEGALKQYMNACIDEWVKRGFENAMRKAVVKGKVRYPPWLGDANFHASHRANLLRKDSEFYSRFGWGEDPAMSYVWPRRG